MIGRLTTGKTLTDPQLSVVIPALDEAQTIGPVLDRVRSANVREMIVADGGSCDDTRLIARRHGATVVRALPGRGRQLNAGAAVSTGDVLLFLHADTLLPSGFDKHVFGILSRPGTVAGAFRLSINASGRCFRLIERMVHVRCRLLQMPFGDQALFMTSETFRRVGGFREVPIMEDYDIVRRLRRMGRLETAEAAVVTSARRWLKDGLWLTTLRNQILIAAYRLEVSPDRIAQWRGTSHAHPADACVDRTTYLAEKNRASVPSRPTRIVTFRRQRGQRPW